MHAAWVMGDKDDDSTHVHLSITLDWRKYNIDKSDRNNAVIRRVDEFQAYLPWSRGSCRQEQVYLARSKHLNLTWISIHESKYKSLAQIYHPDVHKSGVTGLTSEGPTQHMQMINCSCEYLKECFERGTRTYRREREREREGMREEDNWIQSMSKREQSILFIWQWLVHPLITQYPDTCNQQQSVPALFGCVLAYLFNQELAA